MRTGLFSRERDERDRPHVVVVFDVFVFLSLERVCVFVTQYIPH